MDEKTFQKMFSLNWFNSHSELEKTEAYIYQMRDHLKAAVRHEDKFPEEFEDEFDNYSEENVCSSHKIFKEDYPTLFLNSTFIVLISWLERDVKKSLSLILEFQGIEDYKKRIRYKTFPYFACEMDNIIDQNIEEWDSYKEVYRLYKIRNLIIHHDLDNIDDEMLEYIKTLRAIKIDEYDEISLKEGFLWHSIKLVRKFIEELYRCTCKQFGIVSIFDHFEDK